MSSTHELLRSHQTFYHSKRGLQNSPPYENDEAQPKLEYNL